MEKRADFLSVSMVKNEYPFLSPGTLANMRCRKQGPKYHKMGRKVLYKRSDLERWIASAPVLTSDSLQ